MANVLVPEHIFISYSHQDEEFAVKMVPELEKAGIPIWIDRTGLPPGTPNWNSAIRDAISRSFAILLLASPNSEKSNVVQGELKLAESYGCTVYPVCIAGKWEDCVPLNMLHTQFIDCREAKYRLGLTQIIEVLNKVIDTSLPKHFIFKPEPAEIFRPSHDYIYIKLDQAGNFVGMRSSCYKSLRALLDDLYLNYLSEKYKPFSYGTDWLLAAHGFRVPRLLVPWSWFVEKDTHQPISVSNPSWFLSSLETYGLVANTIPLTRAIITQITTAATTWAILDKHPIFTFGVATNDSTFGNILLLNFRINIYPSKKPQYFDDFLYEFRESNVTMIEKSKFKKSDYKYLFVFKVNNQIMDNQVFIPDYEWIETFNYEWVITIEY